MSFPRASLWLGLPRGGDREASPEAGVDSPVARGTRRQLPGIRSRCERASLWPRGGLISHPTNPRARRTSGVLLVAGFAALMPGFVVAAGSQTGTSYIPPTFSTRVGAISLITGVSLTLLGLIAFDAVLWKAGDRVLSGLGTAVLRGGGDLVGHRDRAGARAARVDVRPGGRVHPRGGLLDAGVRSCGAPDTGHPALGGLGRGGVERRWADPVRSAFRELPTAARAVGASPVRDRPTPRIRAGCFEGSRRSRGIAPARVDRARERRSYLASSRAAGALEATAAVARLT